MLWKSWTCLVWMFFGYVYLCTSPVHSTSAGYVFQNGPFIYKVVLPKLDKRTWYEAEEICRIEENGNLLTIGDKKEGRWVNQLIHNLTNELDYLGKFWIGATDKRLKGVYEFIDGSPFRYREAPWAKGEPNRPPKKTFKFEYCISMDPNSGTPTWSDDDCFTSFGYICKSREVPKRLKDNRRFGYAWEWNYYEYKFVPLPYDTMTWSEAELYCQEAESGHLLSIYNSEESSWVTDRIKQIRQVLGFKGLWIGATDIFSRGSFKWTDRGPVNYTRWANGGPKNTSLSRKPREACVAILADPDWGKWDEEFCINKMPFVCKTKKCKGKSDLAFILDASGSVTTEGFQKAKEFILKVMQGFQVTNNETHVGLIRFANDADVIFGLKNHHNILQLKQEIDNMVFVQGETHTDKALNLARTLFSQQAGSRPDVPRIAMVMTDGKSDSFRRTSAAAAKLKAMGVTIVTLGIGNGVDRKELIDMSTSKDYVLYVESYAVLTKRVREIREKVCDEIISQGLIRQRELERQARILAKKRAKERARILALERARKLELQRLSAQERAKKLAEQRRLEQERARKLAEQQRLEKERAKKLAEKQRLERERRKKLEEQRRRQNQRRNQYNRNTQNRNTQNRNTQNRNTQNRNTQNRNTQNRNTQNRNIQNRNQYNRNQNIRNTRKPNIQNRNQYNRNQYNRNTQNRNTQNRNQYNRNTQNRNQYNRNQYNRNTQNRNTQNRNQYNRNTQNRNTQNRNQYNRNTQNRNQYNRNQYNRNTQNRNTQNRNQYNRNQYNRNTQNRNTQNRNQYNRNQYNRNTQNRNTQNRNQYNRNTQNRNTQNRNQYNRNQYNRNTQNRNTQNRNIQNRNQYNRNQYNRNTQNRNIQNRNQYNRNQYNRNQYNRNQYNRNQYNRNTQNRRTQTRYTQNRRTQYNRNSRNPYNLYQG